MQAAAQQKQLMQRLAVDFHRAGPALPVLAGRPPRKRWVDLGVDPAKEVDKALDPAGPQAVGLDPALFRIRVEAMDVQRDVVGGGHRS